jgi:hypothetical protein
MRKEYTRYDSDPSIYSIPAPQMRKDYTRYDSDPSIYSIPSPPMTTYDAASCRMERPTSDPCVCQFFDVTPVVNTTNYIVDVCSVRLLVHICP